MMEEKLLSKACYRA